jgi:hypothetical protein
VYRGRRIELARQLKPGESAALVDLPAGALKLEVQLPGAGLARLQKRSVRLLDGHAYCIFVGGREVVTVRDESRRQPRDPSPDKVCKQIADGQGGP